MTIARLTVQRGDLTEYPLAEKVKGGWQNGVTFYPEADVTAVMELDVTPRDPRDSDLWDEVAREWIEPEPWLGPDGVSRAAVLDGGVTTKGHWTYSPRSTPSSAGPKEAS